MTWQWGTELYDHAADPAELVNLAGSPDVSAILKTATGALHKQFSPYTPPSQR